MLLVETSPVITATNNTRIYYCARALTQGVLIPRDKNKVLGLLPVQIRFDIGAGNACKE